MQKPHTDWSNRRYLIVEGDEKFRAWSEGVLRKVGAVNVHCAASCNDGLVQQEKLHADVVLIDFQLSDLHPVDFMRRIRKLQQKGDAKTLIIPVATAADAAVLRQACLVGIQSFIRKPTDADNFLKRVNGALSNPRRFVFGRRYFGPERRLSQTDYDGADRRIPDAQPAAAPRSIPAAKLSQATGKTKPAQAGEKVKPPQTTGAAKPTARVAEKKATTLAPPIEPPRSQKPTGDDEPLVPVDDGEITLIEDVDVVGIVDKLSPEVKLAVEGHLDWLRTGGGRKARGRPCKGATCTAPNWVGSTFPALTCGRPIYPTPIALALIFKGRTFAKRTCLVPISQTATWASPRCDTALSRIHVWMGQTCAALTRLGASVQISPA